MSNSKGKLTHPNIVSTSTNKYQLGETLGKGGFGIVYKGLDIETGQFVAIKQISLQNVAKEQVSSIMMEIDLLKKLNHINIVQYLSCYGDPSNEHLNIVLEFVENGSLEHVLKKFGKFPESLVCIYITQVLEGLVYLHEQGVIHRDIKGANILITKQGLVKVADFGVSTKLGEANKASLDDVAGSPYWMSPEIIELSGATTESDIWSVGCVVIELLTGAPPYFDLAPMSALFHIVEDEYPPFPSDITSALKDFLMQCFQKDPNLRVSAKKLLQHRWIKSQKKDLGGNGGADKLDNVKLSPRYKVQGKQNAADVQHVGEMILSYNQNLPRNKLRMGNAISPGVSPRDDATTNSSKKGKKKEDKKAKPKKGTKKTKKTRLLLSPRKKKVSKEKDSKIKKPKKEKRSKKKDKKVGKENPKLTSKKRTKGKKKPTSKDLGFDFDIDEGVDLLAKLHNLGKGTDAPVNLDDFADSDNDDWGDELQFPSHRGSRLVRPTRLDLSISGPAATSKGNKIVPPVPKSSSTSTPPSASSPAKANGFADEGEDDDLFSDDMELDFASKLKEKQKQEELLENSFASDDPFGDGFDDSDGDFDTEESAMRDELTRMSEDILQLISRLQRDQKEEVIIDACNQLIGVFAEYPQQKGHFVRHHGVIPIIEMIDDVSNDNVHDKKQDGEAVLHAALQVVNQIMEGSKEIKENLCLVGGIPSIMKFAAASYSKPIRTEAAHFIREMCITSPLTLQMFIACRGLPVLVEFLSSDYKSDRQLVWMAVDAIKKVLDMSAGLPRNDFCRLFARSGVLQPLVLALLLTVADGTEEDAGSYADKICEIMLQFCSADSVVKLRMASAVGPLVENMDILAAPLLLKILRTLKTLTMDSRTLLTISSAQAIPKMVALLSSSQHSADIQADMQKQILPCLFNLLRISPLRQEQAANAGLIPYLMMFIRSNSPLKQFALPIICQMAHRKSVRKDLWRHKGIEFFLEVLALEIKTTWPATVLESLLAWLTAERNRVEAVLIEHIEEFAKTFGKAVAVSFAGMLEPLLRMVTISRSLKTALSKSSSFAPALLAKSRLQHPDALVRVNVLKLATSLYDQERAPSVDVSSLKAVLSSLIKSDPSVVVQDLAAQLSARLH